MNTVISLDNISWIRQKQPIIKNVCWTIQEGEHWALVGRNGSGKTTLLNMINGYLWPTKGSISVLGETFGRVNLQELRKHIGIVSSSLSERFSSTVLCEEVIVSGKFASIGLYDQTEEADFEKATELMKMLGIKGLAAQEYGICSQGEKQKVLIARALMANPKLLILDEPCNGLDLLSREAFLESIETLACLEDGPTLIYVTHHIEEILPVFNKTCLLKDGEVYAQGNKEELLTSKTLSTFFNVPLEAQTENGRTYVKILQQEKR
ncbi:ABC transporter ATP-binding protein [Priestia filamentosa]|uniref:ABC transporter ATP-binding protein n=1 Tax=Priestia filamentosa TaxID=1402861 RepID=UPI003D275600